MLSIEHLYKRFEDYRKSRPWDGHPRELYDPVEYMMSIGGKRMRPLLLLSSYQLYSDNLDKALPAALGVEVLHNFTLVHDDIMDNAAMRRGKPVVHNAFGSNSAILGGDVMMIKSIDFILESCDKETAIEAIQLMLDTSREICEGQQLDMSFETRDQVSVVEYLEMIRLKTAVLLSAALRLGALLAGAPSEHCDRLYEAGLMFGEAFQIQDDLLDAYGKSDMTGKRRGGDIVHSKKTFLYTSTLEQLPALRKDVFIEMYNEKASNPEVKIQKVLRVFDEFDIANVASEKAEEVYHKGVELMDHLAVDGIRKLPLMDFVKQLKVRLV